MHPSGLIAVLPGLIAAQQPVMLHGPPGIGKSDIIRQVGAAMDRNVVDIRAVLLDPVDLRGLPVVTEDGLVKWAPPMFLPHDPESTDIISFHECQ